MPPQETNSRNEFYTISDLATHVRSGRIRVPVFQRSFRWTAVDVLNLFDSILRGYPFGSFLFWKRSAPEAKVSLGAISVHAKEEPDALWVVDGQQRIISLVNAIDAEAATEDPRFLVFYSLTTRSIVSEREAQHDLAVPIYDLFDFGRALNWLSQNPDAAEYAAEIQAVAAQLNRVTVSAAVISNGDESVLREVFDRINSRGRRLNAAEIFDALHSSASTETQSGHSLSSISERIDQQTSFGRLDTKAIVQALLVRRHPDITRDVHGEFGRSRGTGASSIAESEDEAYESTEAVLLKSVRFLQEFAGIPHFAFLPFRFHLLVLSRFFYFYPEPNRRNVELLRRWFWRSVISAEQLKFTGKTSDVRAQAGYVQPDDESGSVQRLLESASEAQGSSIQFNAPELNSFRTNRSSGKVILAALWSLGPQDPVTGERITLDALAESIQDDSSPAAVALSVFNPERGQVKAKDSANVVLTVRSRQDFISSLSSDLDLGSLLLNEELLDAVRRDSVEEFMGLREQLMRELLDNFVASRTAAEFEDVGPLESFEID